MLPFAALSGTAILLACAVPSMPEPPEDATLFAENCVNCHGISATGDGLAAANLAQKPTDLSRIAARNGGVFPTAWTLSVIDGYARQNHTGQIMPEFGAVLTGDLVPVEVDGTVILTPRALAALLVYLLPVQRL